jgi:riboflavin kinase/FMN adenylyltransferase
MEIESFSFTLENDDIKEIAIGRFDGMHLAHQRVFDKLSSSNGAILVIDPGYSNLTPHTYKQKYTSLPIFFLKLSSVKHLDGLEFIDALKDKFKSLEKIVVGYDFRFGKDRKYDIYDLSSKFDGVVDIVDEVKIDSIAVHSKVIREYISHGDFAMANKLLGRDYKIHGYQVRGQGLGKKEFIPTINLNIEEFLLPNEGVYATKTSLNNTIFDSITFVGHRVSTDNSFAVETHIIDKDIDNQNTKEVTVSFVAKIRDNKKFDSFEELKGQILIDIVHARDILFV